MVKVYSARVALEAHFVRNYLEGEGIRAAVLGETLLFARGDLPMTQETLPAVWVNPEDERVAREALARFETEAERVQHPAWNCPECNEHIEGAFSQCWNCGAERPARP